ncbi:MAG: hypothetical protein AAFV53_02855 [Myxococcota bacterium]
MALEIAQLLAQLEASSSQDGRYGRPFMVSAQGRLATVERGEGWQTDELRPDVDELTRTQRHHIATRWTGAGLAEHAAIAAAGRFVLELLSVGAPSFLVASAAAAVNDEVEHARLCFTLASAYTDAPLSPGALPVDGALTATPTLGDVLLTCIDELCIGATLSAVRAAEARVNAADPAVWSVLGRLVDDGWKQSRMGWDVLGWAIRSGSPALEAQIRERFAERIAALGSAPPPEDDPQPADALLIAHGCLPPMAEHRVKLAILQQVLKPCVATFLRGGANQPF